MSTIKTVDIRLSMAEVLEENGLNKISDVPYKPALTEKEHLTELCIVSKYLSSTLMHYLSKIDFALHAEDIETSSEPDKS